MCFNHVPAIFYQIFIFSPNGSTSKRHSTIKAGTPEHGTTEHEAMRQNSSGNTWWNNRIPWKSGTCEELQNNVTTKQHQ